MTRSRHGPRRAVALAFLASAAVASAAPAVAQSEIEEGRRLYEASCLSCHGPEGRGGEVGPPIADAGEAGADFQLRTGRMPLPNPQAQAERKPPAFDDDEIDALVAYVASLGDGPPIPSVDPASGDVALGNRLFVDNCAPCHGTGGYGGAAGPGALAPSLMVAEPVEVAEAMVSGPGQMPVFRFDDHELDSVLAFVARLQERESPGGEDIGGIGPVAEGYVTWVVGMVLILAVVLFVGRREGEQRQGRS